LENQLPQKIKNEENKMEIINTEKSSATKLLFILLITSVIVGAFLVSISLDWSNGGGPGATTAPPTDNPTSMTSCGGTGIPPRSIGHLASNGHGWNAAVTYGSSWLSLVGQTNIIGKGYVNYTFTPNHSLYSRYGIIQLDGYNFVVEQKGNSTPNVCPTITPTYIYSTGAGGTFTISVANWSGNTIWTVDISPTDSSWIGSVQNQNLLTADITVSPNTGGDRITYITVAGTKIPVIQEGISQ
jgi:hypothetical protein